METTAYVGPTARHSTAMDITQLYAAALGGFVTLFLLTYRLLSVINIHRTGATFYFLKYAFYPPIHRYLSTTRFELFLIVAFLVGNILGVCIDVKDVSELIARSALIFTLNLIPLSFGSHMNLIANTCGVRLPTYARMHRWLGRVAIAEGIAHVAAAVILKRASLRAPKDIAAVIAASTLAIILVSSLPQLRLYAYEFFAKLHFILVATLVASIYVHIAPRDPFTPPSVYLFSAACLQIVLSFLRFGQVLYRNVKHKEPFTRAKVRTLIFKRRYGSDIPVTDAVHVHVQLPRPWRPQAGQYVYFSTSFAQSHPFYVSWWYRDTKGHDFVVLIVQRRKGFTRNLLLRAMNSFDTGDGQRAVIEGPYGNELDLTSYGTVLLFATGIGIAAQLPYVRVLLESYHNYDVKSRKIALFWEIDSEVHTAWVADMMKELLEKDVDKILDIQVFVKGNYISLDRRPGDVIPLGKRIDMNYLPMDAASLIKTQSGIRKGYTVVSLCTDNDTRDKIRAVVCSIMDRDIRLKELDFSPFRPHREKWHSARMALRNWSKGGVGR